MRKATWVVGLVLLVANARPAGAAFHIMRIVEIFPGTTGSPNAQFIELQMAAAGQNVTGGHTVTVYNAAGTLVATYTLANVANGSAQDTVLIATADAVTLFAPLTADAVMPTAAIPLAGGKVCFENIDCVAWGNYTGTSNTSAPGQPAYQANGLVLGRSLQRNLGANNTLQEADDTNNSAADFTRQLPSPKNNARTTGTNPNNTCGNNTTEGLESCDDNNTAANDGCSAMCVTESCGDGVVQTSEQCDDTNTITTDACSNTCMNQVAQPDGAPDAGVNPTPDAGGNNNNDDGGGGCCETGGAGASPLLALLVLGLLLRRRAVS